MYFPPLFRIPVFVPPTLFLSFSGSYCTSSLASPSSFPFLVPCLQIILSLSTYLSPFATPHHFSLSSTVFPSLLPSTTYSLFPPFLQSLNSFICSSRTPTRGEAGQAGGQLPVTPPEAGAGATAALQLRLTLASPKGAAAASIRGASTAC